MKRFTIALILLVVSGCASMQSPPPGDAEKFINGMNRDFSDFVRRGDVASIANVYADQAVFMAPNAEPARGREAIRQVWSGFLSSGRVELSLGTDNVIQSCDLAAEIGHYDLMITPSGAGAAPIRDRGKYVVNWRYIDGKWRIVADIFNSSAPAR